MKTQDLHKLRLAMVILLFTTVIISSCSIPKESVVPTPPTPKAITSETKPSVSTAIEKENTKSWKTYLSSQYQFQYPTNYTVEEPTESFKVLTVRGPEGKVLEIFKQSDFADRPFGFTGEETQKDIDSYVPKETRKIASEKITAGPASSTAYEVWLFWPKDNLEIEKEVKKITDTIQIK